MDTKRRTLLHAGLASLPIALANKHAVAAESIAPGSIALWPENRIPGGPGPQGPESISKKGSVKNISQPRLTIYRPDRPNGAAVLVIAGGGYAHIELGTESTPACRWLQSIGVTAFELIYRLPGENWPHTAPLQDGQRAMRLIRATAASHSIDPARIGTIGFSAGGHLAGMTATTPTINRYPPVDASDAMVSRPAFAGLIYPVLTLMPPFDHTHARREIVGDHPSAQASAEFSVDRQVTAQTPPVFLAQALDDPISPVDNSFLMAAALRRAGVQTELHVFQTGRHGWGLGKPGMPVHAWPLLFTNWAVQNQFWRA